MHAPAQQLAGRFDAVEREAAQARERFHAHAANEARALTQRFQKFEAVRAEIRELFKPRLDALVRRIPDAKPLVESGADRGEMRLILGHTTECPPLVTLTMAVSHDGRAERVVLDYTLSIVPIFMEFSPSARFESPIEPFDCDGASRWIEDQLVEFLKTYKSIPMVEAYQRDCMVLDPVARVWFGKGLAKAQRTAAGATYYFASDDAAQEFDRDPARYTGQAAGNK